MNLIELIPGLHQHAATTKRGPEYIGPCPLCGAGTDRFHVWPEQGVQGTFWCRFCDVGGDAIEFVRLSESLSYRQACQRLGLEPATNGRAPLKSAPRVAVKPKAAAFTPSASAAAASDLWQAKAAILVAWAHEQLLANAEQLTWLSARGINLDLVKRYLLGWLPTDVYRPRSSWGLAEETKGNGQAKKLWIPSGLVIPWMIDEQVHRLRIRRPDGQPRYYVVPGSGMSMMISRHGAPAYQIVEAELDLILLDGVAGDLVGIVAMGNSSAKPDTIIWPSLAAAVHLSVSLDSDAAGIKHSRWWTSSIKCAERIPVLDGKDPGDAYAAGCDLRSWVLAGLPPRFHVAAAKTEAPAAAPAVLEAELPAVNTDYRPAPGKIHFLVDQADGSQVHVTDDPDLCDAIAADGLLVYSVMELERIKQAGPAAADVMAAVNQIKDIMPGATVRRYRKEKEVAKRL